MFSKVDVDGGGSVSLEEFEAWWIESQRQQVGSRVCLFCLVRGGGDKGGGDKGCQQARGWGMNSARVVAGSCSSLHPPHPS